MILHGMSLICLTSAIARADSASRFLFDCQSTVIAREWQSVNDGVMRLPFVLRAALTIPLLPALYLHAKRVRAAVPKLNDAEGPEGTCGDESHAPLRVVFIGESTIAGLGAKTHDEAFSGSFARELSIRLHRRVSWQVVARSGFSTGRVTRSLVPKIPPDVDLIVAGIGGNDAFELRSPRRFHCANW
jgi:hypothetical protein